MARLWQSRHLVQGTVVHVMGWVSQQYGSFERFLERLAARCAEEGLKTHLVFPKRPVSEDFIRNVQADIHVVPLAKHPLDFSAWRGLRDVFRRTNATHVHAHFGLDAMIAMQAASGRRRFLTKHITPGKGLSSSLRHRWLGSKAEVFFAVSRKVAEDLVTLGVPKHKVSQVYLGVDTRVYQPRPRTPGKVILCASHLREGKGVEFLPALARNLPDATVISAGDGPLRPLLEREAPPNMKVLGLRQDMPDLLASADVFVFPTTGTEGMGLGPLEALATGLPIVATAVSDLPEVLGDAMYLIPPGDIDALTKACRMFLDDRAAARELGDRARQAAVERFSVDVALEAYLSRYLA
jgi:glycosyltransferase involved in cell wall biosynthesis